MIKNFKLFNLKLLTSKLITDQFLKKNNLSLTALATRIKKFIKIIHKYHIYKKRILFIGNPMNVNNQLTYMLKKSNHVFIPRSAWVAGHLTNKFTQPKKLRNGCDHTKLFSIHKFKKLSSLVVIIDELVDYTALNEHREQRIPVIVLNSETSMLKEICEFRIPAKLVSLQSDLNASMFYYLLLTVLKSSNTKKYSHYKKHLTKKKPKRINYPIAKKNHKSIYPVSVNKIGFFRRPKP